LSNEWGGDNGDGYVGREVELYISGSYNNWDLVVKKTKGGIFEQLK